MLYLKVLVTLQVGDTGFSIVAAKKANMLSLVIGPGAGYNLVSVTAISASCSLLDVPFLKKTTFDQLSIFWNTIKWYTKQTLPCGACAKRTILMLCKAIIAVFNMEPSWLNDLLIYVFVFSTPPEVQPIIWRGATIFNRRRWQVKAEHIPRATSRGARVL